MSLIIEVFTISAPKEPGANATTGRTDSRQINGFADVTGPEPTLNRRKQTYGAAYWCHFLKRPRVFTAKRKNRTFISLSKSNPLCLYVPYNYILMNLEKQLVWGGKKKNTAGFDMSLVLNQSHKKIQKFWKSAAGRGINM